MRLLALLPVAVVSGCTFGLDRANVERQTPMFSEVMAGRYDDAAACATSEIQRGDYTLHPQVQMIDHPSDERAEVTITASSGMTGTLWGAIASFEQVDADSHEAVVRAATRPDGEEAVLAIRRCSMKVVKAAGAPRRGQPSLAEVARAYNAQ